jgi:hypothetical protein
MTRHVSNDRGPSPQTRPVAKVEARRSRVAAGLAGAEAALVKLGRLLASSGYQFITVTPETHRLVLARDTAAGRGRAMSLRDVFGWNKPFAPALLSKAMLAQLEAAQACTQEGGLLRARVRFSSHRGRLFAHSGFPTMDTAAVFFGPDSYRFCAVLERFAPGAQRLVDVGCGSGVGGLTLCASTRQIVLSDINETALHFARVNAALAGVDAEIVHSDVLAGVDGRFDLVIANPPYLRDDTERIYREGGGEYGEGLAVRIVADALERLQSGGQLLVYTGTAVVSGEDRFYRAVQPVLDAAGVQYRYTEIDPDVFGAELQRPAYAQVERLAAVALCARVR